ncbi:hypothetical protein BC831DRAFT_444143, partial [Entophlyctis helioformis]
TLLLADPAPRSSSSTLHHRLARCVVSRYPLAQCPPLHGATLVPAPTLSACVCIASWPTWGWSRRTRCHTACRYAWATGRTTSC